MLFKLGEDIVGLPDAAELAGVHEHGLDVGGLGKRGAGVFADNHLEGVGLPSRAPPIAPARPHPQPELDFAA